MAESGSTDEGKAVFPSLSGRHRDGWQAGIWHTGCARYAHRSFLLVVLGTQASRSSVKPPRLRALRRSPRCWQGKACGESTYSTAFMFRAELAERCLLARVLAPARPRACSARAGPRWRQGTRTRKGSGQGKALQECGLSLTSARP